MATITESDWRALLNDALDGIKGIGRATLEKVLDEYAPRLSAASSVEELDDLRVNIEAEGLIAGIRAEAQARKIIGQVLLLAIGIAQKALL